MDFENQQQVFEEDNRLSDQGQDTIDGTTPPGLRDYNHNRQLATGCSDDNPTTDNKEDSSKPSMGNTLNCASGDCGGNRKTKTGDICVDASTANVGTDCQAASKKSEDSTSHAKRSGMKRHGAVSPSEMDQVTLGNKPLHKSSKSSLGEVNADGVISDNRVNPDGVVSDYGAGSGASGSFVSGYRKNYGSEDPCERDGRAASALLYMDEDIPAENAPTQKDAPPKDAPTHKGIPAENASASKVVPAENAPTPVTVGAHNIAAQAAKSGSTPMDVTKSDHVCTVSDAPSTSSTPTGDCNRSSTKLSAAEVRLKRLARLGGVTPGSNSHQTPPVLKDCDTTFLTNTPTVQCSSEPKACETPTSTSQENTVKTVSPVKTATSSTNSQTGWSSSESYKACKTPTTQEDTMEIVSPKKTDSPKSSASQNNIDSTSSLSHSPNTNQTTPEPKTRKTLSPTKCATQENTMDTVPPVKTDSPKSSASQDNCASPPSHKLMLQKREAWLKRMAPASPPQNGEEATSPKQHKSNTSASSSITQNLNQRPRPPGSLGERFDISPKPQGIGRNATDRADSGADRSNDVSPSEPSPSPSSSGSSASSNSLPNSGDSRPTSRSRLLTQQPATTAAASKTTDSAPKDEKQKNGTSSRTTATTPPVKASMSTSLKSKKDETEDSSGDAKKAAASPSKDQTPPKPTPTPPPAEKTTDPEKVKGFLEKAFSCTITLTDDLHRMRFSGGKMRIPTNDFPFALEGLEAKMKSLIHSAFDKQVNKVKFSINAYNMCESDGSSFHDCMVDTTVAVVKREAVVAILNHFRAEAINSSQGDDDGLYGSGGGSEMYETYGFLPRLTGSANDHVNISASLLSELLTSDCADVMITCLLSMGGHRLSAIKRLDEMLLSESATLHAVDVLVQNAHFGDALGKVLAKENERALVESLGVYFEKKAALSPLLSLSTIPQKPPERGDFQLPPSAVTPFKSARSFPNLSHDDVQTIQTMIRKGIHKAQEIVFTAMRRVLSGKTTREAGLAWLATLINLNELRTSSVMQSNAGVQPVCSDGFMLNLSAVLLELFLPISQSWDKLQKVDTSYSASPTCRLSYDFESCLAGGQIVSDKGEQGSKKTSGDEESQHSFITECYHLTQRALSVTVVPAIKHFNKMNTHYSGLMQNAPEDKKESFKNSHVLTSVVWDTCLVDPDLARNITLFYISQAKLLLAIIKDAEETHKNEEDIHKAQKKALSTVPEFCIKDMAQWFSFLAWNVLRVHPNATKGISLTPFVDCCVMLLERPDLMPGPVPASMIVSALLAFMKDQDSERTQRFGMSWGSGIMSDLAAMVHTCPSVQNKLGPALLRTYVNVDVVEGLDVDKDSFDKFSSRIQIGQLVGKLWSRTDCRASIISECGTELFQNFLDSILDTLLYMLHDSLSRLANVKKIETMKENEQEWKALSWREQQEKDMFLRSEEHVGSGFMRQAKKTLKFLVLLSQSEKVARCFTQQPLARRAGSTINGFLDALCGTKAKSLKVKDMSKYEFNPVELLLDIVDILLRIVVEDTSPIDGYLVSMVKDPDFELANLEKAETVIVNKGCAADDTLQKVSSLMETVRRLAKEHNDQPQSSAEDENNWREAFIDLEVDKEQLEQSYVADMEDRRFGEARISESHCFLGNMNLELDARSPKVKQLMKEIRQLATSLPVHPDAAVFVRQDKNRVDVMRAMVTGPTGTPYSLGCFCFDVFFPSSYPNVPPLVKIITTGNGTVRFNPNLYADGKVCLSLLGTWHAGDASEKWTPGKSSLYQVLVSIQSMILTADPVFNEPGYERIRDTAEGEVQSRQYNWKLHLHTLRHAILGQLKNPPPGFELLVRHHFALQREAVLKQCAEWVQNCEDPDIVKRMRRAADQIFEELMCLEVDLTEEEDVDSEEDEDAE